VLVGLGDSSELSGAPHLVSVQLVGATKYVSILLGVSALLKSVSGLEAELFVPGKLLVASTEGGEFGIRVCCHFY